MTAAQIPSARSAGASRTNDPHRRLSPRIIDTDWMLLRALQKSLRAHIAERARPGVTALDFGCGSSPYAPLIETAGARYLGADFDPGATVRISADGRLAATDASVDLVLSIQVLEHVRDLATYFAEAKRVLRPGGWMVLSTHGSWLYHPHPEDHRRWTREGLVNDIEAHGFEVVGCESLVGPLAWTTMLRLTGAAFVLRKIPLVGRALTALLALVMNVRAWLEDLVTPKWVTRDNACVYVALCRVAS